MDIGFLGEDYAANYLENHNFNILERNFRFGKFGEIDIIALENEYICFIEVKTRTSILFGMPSESVNTNKQKKIKSLAQIYLKRKRLLNTNIRFDIIEVFLEYGKNNKYTNRDSYTHFNTNNTGRNMNKDIGNYVQVKEINLIRNAF